MIQNQIHHLYLASSQFFFQRKKLSLILFFTIISFLIYGHFVFTGKFTACGDFGPAVSYALNFKESFNNGQWIPRWVIFPRDVTFGGGSIDGTAPTIDSPVFQYYGFLQSALAYPLISIGISAIVSLQLIVIFAFTFSGIVLYAAGRVLGANRVVSFLGGYAYVMSPWLISNFYGRGGISESLGQSALPLILLGYAFAIKSMHNKVIISMALAVFILALSHNIFMLYGVVLCGLLIFSNVILMYLNALYVQVVKCFNIKAYADTQKLNQNVANENIKLQIILAAGVLIGLAASSWQWMPALMTLKELSFSYIGNFDVHNPPSRLADLSGAWSFFPKQFVEPWSGTKREFFFTIGWWTIPGIASLFFAKKGLRIAAFSIFLSFIIFFVLTFLPNIIFPFLPGFFGAIQFTFRLLAFLSVLGSFALCVSFPNMSRNIGAIIFILITISQLPVILFHMPDQQFPDVQYLKGYEYNAFYANSTHEKYLRNWYDGWLDARNILNLSNADNIASYLKITGKTRDNVEKVKIFIAKVGDPAHPVSNVIEVQRGRFQALFQINKPEDGLRIYALSGNTKIDLGASLIRPEEVLLLSDPPASFIPATDLTLDESHGYKRVFSINKNKFNVHQPNHNGLYTIELPVIYNKFSVPSQNGVHLNGEVDFNHRLVVTTHSLSSPIIVRYSLPVTVWLISIFGIIMFCSFVGFSLAQSRWRQLRINFNSTPVTIEC
ncbi:MAG: hypothetical protein P4M12_05440 [Gammaproteobacteria bacterium]|nr:hypothetical protein [Gammaproteobacteria bacterium]